MHPVGDALMTLNAGVGDFVAATRPMRSGRYVRALPSTGTYIVTGVGPGG